MNSFNFFEETMRYYSYVVEHITKRVSVYARMPQLSAHTLALSWAIGLYVAFSPFPGFHTVMLLGLRFIVPSLCFPVMFIACCLNNPWTMVPFYCCDYAAGYYLVHSIAGFNPSLTIYLDNIGLSGRLCVWSFLIGGNVLGVCAALISYPCMKWFFMTLKGRL